MNEMTELIWHLNAKSFKICSLQKGIDNGQCFVNLFLHKNNIVFWEDLIIRLNSVYNSPYQFIKYPANRSEEIFCTILFNTLPNESQKLNREINILSQSILFEEYRKYPAGGSKCFTLKLGMSCNNNCIHCVIKPKIFSIKKHDPQSVILDSGIGMQCLKDLSFTEVIEILDNISTDINCISLTGGEPTIRKDFINIIKWIYYNKPHIDIAIQTNGRNFSDKAMVKGVRRYSRKPAFAISMHGMEATHNKIVNNRKEKGNPFNETIQGIKNIFEIFGQDYFNIRTEVVMSSYNIDEIFETVRFNYEELGIKRIGISFPHLGSFSRKDVVKISPDISKVSQVLKQLNNYLLKNKDLVILLEEIPFCMINEINSEIGLQSFENRNQSNLDVNFMGDDADDFQSEWVSDHVKLIKCKDCMLDKECIGVWKENRLIFEEHIKPIITLSSNMYKFVADHWGFETLQRLERR